jgi:hypothetical protein
VLNSHQGLTAAFNPQNKQDAITQKYNDMTTEHKNEEQKPVEMLISESGFTLDVCYPCAEWMRENNLVARDVCGDPYVSDHPSCVEFIGSCDVCRKRTEQGCAP